VVLGGLMRTREDLTESKIPLLGDIPVLGYLFKYKTRSKQKTNVLVLLTPYIVQQQIDLERIVERRTREHQEFLRAFATFSTFEYHPDIDYRRKRGLVEEINKVVKRYEEEAIFLKAQDEKGSKVTDGPIDFTDTRRLNEDDSDGNESDDSAPPEGGKKP
jgi:general secretion pathway protein D